MLEGPALATPPASPAPGACYIVASGATGVWSGKDGMLAGFTEGGWRFFAPIEGTRALERASGEIVVRRSGLWESGIVRAREVKIDGLTVVRERQPDIADPAGGSVVDAEGRLAIVSILDALRDHGLIG